MPSQLLHFKPLCPHAVCLCASCSSGDKQARAVGGSEGQASTSASPDGATTSSKAAPTTAAPEAGAAGEQGEEGSTPTATAAGGAASA
eukprot:scaffold261247_cov17-Tisochrysis_lutea.AAC.1